jgi:hypothetical protein
MTGHLAMDGCDEGRAWENWRPAALVRLFDLRVRWISVLARPGAYIDCVDAVSPREVSHGCAPAWIALRARLDRIARPEWSMDTGIRINGRFGWCGSHSLFHCQGACPGRVRMPTFDGPADSLHPTGRLACRSLLRSGTHWPGSGLTATIRPAVELGHPRTWCTSLSGAERPDLGICALSARRCGRSITCQRRADQYSHRTSLDDPTTEPGDQADKPVHAERPDGGDMRRSSGSWSLCDRRVAC